METEGKKILVDYLTDVADTFRGITGETGLIDARTYSTEIEKVAGGSGSKNSYQRNSVEEMNAITDAKDWDTCLCYYNEILPITKDSVVRTIIFPEEVVFENAIAEFHNANIGAVDSSIELYGMISLSPNGYEIRVDKMDDQSRINVSYSSEDGITYKLNKPLDIEGSFKLVDERTIDFKIDINIEDTNEQVGQFMLSRMGVFKGMYVRLNNEWIDIDLGYSLNEYNVETAVEYYNNGKMKGRLGKIETAHDVVMLNKFINKYGVEVAYPSNMSHAFSGLAEKRIPLLEISHDMSTVTNMNGMFYGDTNLEEIPQLLNTGNVTDTAYMFKGCSSLKSIPLFDTSKSNNIASMFEGCSSLKTIPPLNTESCRYYLENTFRGCSALETIPQIKTSEIGYWTSTFNGCTSLTEIPLLDADKAETFTDTFKGCFALTTFGGLKNLGKKYYHTRVEHYEYYTLDLSDSQLLTHESLMNVINNLYDIKSIGVKTQKLKIGETNKAKLTAEEIAIATNKGWSVE